MRPVRLTAASLAAFLALGSCSKDSTSPSPAVAAIHVTPGTDTVGTLGRTVTFVAQPVDANGSPVTATVVWRSSNPSVVTVDSATGLATAVTNGSAVISAHVGNVSGQGTMAVAQVVAHVVISPPSAAFTAVGDTQRLTAVAKDSSGALVQGVPFLWVSSDANVATVDTAGLVTTKGTGQAFAIAAGRGVPGSATLTVNQAAASLVITTQPGSVTAGDAFSPALTVEIRDGNGHPVGNSQALVTLALSGTGTLHGTSTVAAVGGRASFSGLWVDRTGAGNRLIASAAGLVTKDTSSSFSVSPGPPSVAYFQQPPTGGQGNLPLPPFQVNVNDAYGNPTDATVSVNFGSAPWAQAVLGGNTSLPTSNGVAVFDSVTIDRPGSGYTLVANVSQGFTSLLPFESHPFAVTLHFTAMSTGLFQTCGETDGGAYCWGYPFDSVPAPLSGRPFFDSLTAGDYHSCGLKADGTVWCWGENPSGETGTGAAGGTVPSPTKVAGGLTFIQVVAGHHHTCALAVGGAAYCWGLNSSGQLGDSTTTNRSSPTLVAGGLTFVALAAGGSHTCAASATDSAVYCWGANAKGQLGNGTVTPDSAPHQVSGPLSVREIAASDQTTCADSAGGTSVYCWGDDSYGEMFFVGTSATPKRIGGLGGFGEIAGSLGNYLCFTSGADNTCVGDNGVGQFGNGGTGGGKVNGSIVFDHIRAGAHHTCGLSSQHGLYCWGYQSAGELGNGSTLGSYVPVRVLQ